MSVEWALAQAANGFISYDPADETFSLSPEQAMIFAVKDSPVYLAGAFDLVAAMIESEQKVERAIRTGVGVRWGDLPDAYSVRPGLSSVRVT